MLELESASYKTPERVEIVARTLLGMEPPPPERIVPLAADRVRLRTTTTGRVPRAREGSAVRNLDPRRARWIRTRMGVLCGVMGLALGGIVSSAWRVQVEDGARVARHGREAAAAAPSRRAEARHNLRPQRNRRSP